MLTVLVLIFLAAFILCIASAIGKCPLWIPVLLLAVGGLLAHLPLGR